MSVKILRLVAPVAALTLVLSACSPDQAGTAAFVGKRRITTDQLQGALDGLRKGNPQFAQVVGLDKLVLFDLIAEPYLLAAAAGAGLTLPPDQAVRAELPQTPHANPQALRALRAQVALNLLRQGQKDAALATVANQLRAARIRVNPRYGSFDKAQLTITDAAPNWLVSRPAPAPTGAPATP